MSAAVNADPASLPANQRARRGRIVQAAVELLEAGEYDSIQMRDVAERADVALGTLYRYFTSKEHLYAAALLSWSSDAAAVARRPPAGGSDAERLRALLRRSVRAFERWPQMLRAEIALESSSDDNARVLFDEFTAHYTASLAGALSDLPADQAAGIVEVASTMLGTCLRRWALGRCQIADVQRSLDRTVDLIFGAPAATGEQRGAGAA